MPPSEAKPVNPNQRDRVEGEIARSVAADVSADELFGQMLSLLRRLESDMKGMDHPHGMSGSQLWAFCLIAAQPGLRISDMAEAMHIHHSSASNLLDKIEARGLIRRERQAKDSRVVRLWLTAQGQLLQQETSALVQVKLRQALAALDAQDRTQVSAALTRVLSVVEP